MEVLYCMGLIALLFFVPTIFTITLFVIKNALVAREEKNLKIGARLSALEESLKTLSERGLDNQNIECAK